MTVKEALNFLTHQMQERPDQEPMYYEALGTVVDHIRGLEYFIVKIEDSVKSATSLRPDLVEVTHGR